MSQQGRGPIGRPRGGLHRPGNMSRIQTPENAAVEAPKMPRSRLWLLEKEGSPLGVKAAGKDASLGHMLSIPRGTRVLEGSSDHQGVLILIGDSALNDEFHQPPPVPQLVSLHRTGIDQGRRRRSSLSSRPLPPRSLPLRSTSRGRGEDRGDGGTQTGANEVLYFDHIMR